MSASDTVRKWLGIMIIGMIAIVAAIYILGESTPTNMPPIKSQRMKTQAILENSR